MMRDAWYAAIAAAALCAAAAAYALVKAPKLADPNIRLQNAQITASLPSPPPPIQHGETLRAAQAILTESDPFTQRDSGSETRLRGLELPRLGRPVQFSAPDESVAVSPAPLQPAAQAPPAPLPQDVPREQAPKPQGSLTLRGVYPSPTGGRALVAMPDGGVVSVGVGGVVGGWRVLQIQQGAIRLGRGQRVILLAMPR